MDGAGLLAFLDSRRGILDGVCVTGGEPTLQPGLADLLRQIRQRGFLIKLDTNGSRPHILRGLVEEGLVDYVAMDVKNGPEAYGKTVGLESFDLAPIEESIRFLAEGRVDYELRTTVAPPLHDGASLAAMGAWLLKLTGGEKVRRLFLQAFVDRDTVLMGGLRAPDRAELESYGALLAPCTQHLGLRGV
jgi:pyruvate formate lyase activating enzyme